MKKIFAVVLFALFAAINVSLAQDAKVVTLEQTPGEFTVKEISLSPGTYVFEVNNSGVDHEVGFVIAPEGKTDQANHIKAAYLSNTIKDGASAQSKEVNLAKGTYVYFCPLNPTPQYKLVVE